MRSIKKFLSKKKSHLRKMIASRKKLLIITFSLFVAFGSLSFFSFQGNQNTPPSVPSSSELGIAAFSPLGESGGSVVPASCPSDLHDAPANYGQACSSAPNDCGSTNTGNINCGGACSASPPAPACAPCYPWGNYLASGSSVSYYDASSVTSPAMCTGGTFTCSNGVLLGYTVGMSAFPSCVVNPGPCTFSGSVSWPPGCGAAVSGTLPSGAGTTVTNTNAGYSGSKNYSCSNGTWIAGSESCTPVAGPVAPTINSFTGTYGAQVNQTTLNLPTGGGTVTLKWSTTNATSCFAYNDWTDWKVVNNSIGESVSPTLPKTYTYTLECWNSTGVSTGQRSVTVNVAGASVPAPTLIFSGPSSVPSGDSPALDWSTMNADGVPPCTATGGWSGPKASTSGGPQSQPSIVSPTTYTLTCKNSVGATVTRSVSVGILAAVTCTSNCSTTENNHCGGQSYTGTDSCGNAEACTGTRLCDYNWKEVAP